MSQNPGTSVKLRDYQSAAIEGCHRAWRGEQRGTGVGRVNRIAVVLPTGAGKTVVFAHPDFRNPVIGAGGLTPGKRMLVLVHRDELAAQAVAKLRSIDPAASVGRVQATWDETDAQIIVGSVQTLARPGRRERIRDVGLVVVDEAHHAIARTYVDVLRHFGAWSGVPVAGFSATLARSSEDEHLGDVWTEVVLRKDIIDGIRAGWLVDVKGKQVKINGLDMRDVRRVAGDYSEHDLSEHLLAADAPDQVAGAYRDLAFDRQGVMFWPDVDSADAGADALRQVGISAELIVGSTSTAERAPAYDRYRRGDTQVLSSCMVLTEGWDAPWASCAVIARPTQSAPLYVQMVGRVLRPWHMPGRFARKRDALVLDVVGVAGRHRLATLADLSITTKQVKETESLTEAAEREEAAEADGAAFSEPVTRIDGERVVKDVDLFGNRASLWLQTPAGTWFIPAGRWTVFLWPTPEGLWDIGVTLSHGQPGQASPVARGMTLDWAMVQAEGYAERVVSSGGMRDAGFGGVRTNSRTAGWRSSSALATETQRRKAASLGRPLPEGTTKAQASDLISVTLATRALGG